MYKRILVAIDAMPAEENRSALARTEQIGRLTGATVYVLHFARAPGFGCLVNLSARPVPLPDGAAVLLASGPLDGDRLVPADTAVWLSA